MQVISSIAELRERLKDQKNIGFVPTLGNLHDGHIKIVGIAKEHAAFSVVSVFVNRLQFDPGGDFDRYPRTLMEDCAKLDAAGVDIVFAPDEKDLYPAQQVVFVEPSPMAVMLEGEHRPGHFRGVTTVVLKLLNIVEPDVVVFGKKDYQQLAILRAMVEQLNVPVEVIGGETVRAEDGLALSSRNSYLTPAQRIEAPRLQRHLSRIKFEIEKNKRDNFKQLENLATEDLEIHGWKPDYVSVRNRHTLNLPNPDDKELVVLAAVWLGNTRLIDNLEITLGK
ncbi:MAG: pantoate--beta-alanine ligase [Burkholderiales bacterium]